MVEKRGKTRKEKEANSGPVRIGEILPQLFARYGFHRQLEHDALIAAWNETIAPLLPESLKNASFPGAVKRGILEVRLEHAAIVQELSLHEKEILARLREKLPDSKIRKIRYKVE